MFEIKLTRNHDGRFIASIPDLHVSCFSLGNTAQAAVRTAQRTAFNILTDFMRGDKAMPAAMRTWFHVLGKNGSIDVGGCHNNEFTSDVLMHPDNDMIPPPPPNRSLPSLPKHDTPEYDELMRTLAARGRNKIP